MKKILITVFALLVIIGTNAMDKKIIRISTDHTDLVLQVANNGRLYQSYFGERLLNDSDLKELGWNIHAASDGSVSSRG